MKLPPYIIWSVIGAGLIAIGALNVSIGRRAKGSLIPAIFIAAWLTMWLLIGLGGWILVYSLFFMGRGNA